MKFNANMFDQGNKLLASRRDLAPTYVPGQTLKPEAEGGCGVTGFAASVPVSGRHIFQPSIQMHNRGNGKGGGIAAVGLDPDSLGVSREILDEDYLIQVAFLDPEVRPTGGRKIYQTFPAG